MSTIGNTTLTTQVFSYHSLVVSRIYPHLSINFDVAHAIHPNYPEKHEKNDQPVLNNGTVIKTNQNQRFATNAKTEFLLRELARRADAPVQEFVVRNDCPCGSIIGPIISFEVGILTVDLGIPSLSIHSIRETMGCQDLGSNARLFTTFYGQFGELDWSYTGFGPPSFSSLHL